MRSETADPCSSVRINFCPSSIIGKLARPCEADFVHTRLLASLGKPCGPSREVEDVRRSLQLGHQLMTEGMEVLRYQLTAPPVVLDHLGQGGRSRGPAGDHDRHQLADRLEHRFVAAARGDDDDGIDPPAQHVIEDDGKSLVIILGLGDQREHPGRLDRPGQTMDDRRDERVSEIGGHDADGGGPPIAKAAGDQIGPVAEPGGRIEDQAAGGLLDSLALLGIECPGNRRRVDPGEAGNIEEA